MRMTLRLALLAAATLFPTGTMLNAAPSAPRLMLESRMFREVEKPDANGAMRLALSTVTTMRSGDRLLFVIRYHNPGAAPVTGTAIVSPLPARIAVSADQSARIEVSIDGGRRWDRPGATFVTDEHGRLKPAVGQQATHVRLRIDRAIAPGASGQEMFRATIL